MFLAIAMVYLVGVGITYESLKGGEFDVRDEVHGQSADPPFGVFACIGWPLVWSAYIPLTLGVRLTQRTKEALQARKVPKAYLPDPKHRLDD